METIVTVLLYIVFGIPMLLVIINLIRLFFVGMYEVWHNILFGPPKSNDPTFLERYRERNK